MERIVLSAEARSFRAHGDRCMERSRQASKDGDHKESVHWETRAKVYYAKAREIEFADMKELPHAN